MVIQDKNLIKKCNDKQKGPYKFKDLSSKFKTSLKRFTNLKATSNDN